MRLVDLPARADPGRRLTLCVRSLLVALASGLAIGASPAPAPARVGAPEAEPHFQEQKAAGRPVQSRPAVLLRTDPPEVGEGARFALRAAVGIGKEDDPHGLQRCLPEKLA
jgi:hypothetical protein